MGIRLLNRYLREHVSAKALREIHLSELKHKSIVIDTSIYLYKLKNGPCSEELKKNFTVLLDVFQSYKITPIFIFDGVPPPEKNETLNQRNLIKCKAEEEIRQLQLHLTTETDEQVIQQIHATIGEKEKKCIRITNYDIRSIKNIMEERRITYIQADGEADALCVRYVKKKMAFACLSDDMDMFVYGCHRVIRNLNIDKHKATQYNFSQILLDLRLNYYEFRDICVLVSNDYNQSKLNIYMAMGLFKKFKHLKNQNKIGGRFYTWMKSIGKIESVKELVEIVELFKKK